MPDAVIEASESIMKTLLNIITVLSIAIGILGFLIPKDRAPAWEAAAREGLLKIADAAKRHIWAVVIGLAAAFYKFYDFIADHLYLARNVAPHLKDLQNQWQNDPAGVVSVMQAIAGLLLVAVVLIVAYLALLLVIVLVGRVVANHSKGAIAGASSLVSVLSQILKFLGAS